MISTELLLIGVVAVVVIVGFIVFKKNITPKVSFLGTAEKGKRHHFRLIDKVKLSHDVRRFRLALPNKNAVLGLAPGKHLQVFGPNAVGCVPGEWNGRPDKETGDDEIMRKYTPTTSDRDAVGHVDLVLKVYRRQGELGSIPQCPDGGKMSQWLDTLPIGSDITVKGPVGIHEYLGCGLFKDGAKKLTARNIGLIAGGTGITPMLQIMKAVLDNPRDKCTVSLLYANKSIDDILVRDYLEEYLKKFPSRVKIWYTLDSPPANWVEESFSDGIGRSAGFVSAKMIEESLPAPSSDTVVLCCGPPPMIKYALEPSLAELGHPKDRVVYF